MRVRLSVALLLCASAWATLATALHPHREFPRYDNTTFSSKAAAAPYTFAANTHSNIAVYYGKTALSLQTNLTAQCEDPNVDIVILGFLLNVLGPGNLPTMAINNTAGDMCELPDAAMLAAGGAGLKRCATLQGHIMACQSLGKKVFISLGGKRGTQTFVSQAEAEQAASVLWDLFGSGNGLDASLRPFGENVTVDGFDIDNETGNGSYYPEFVSKLRSLTKSQSLKQYFLSAAPACYVPNAGAPVEMLTQMDFVWPQFYGSVSCNIGTSNFTPSFTAWSSRLDAGNKPRLFIGGASWANATRTGGYVSPQQLNQTILSSVASVGTSRFGGVMLWDAAYGHVMTDPETGLDIIAVAKGSLLMSAANAKRHQGPATLLPVVATVVGLGLLT